MNKPRVTLLLRYFTVGGLERVVSSLANSYVAQGIETQVIVMSTGKRNALITELDQRVKVILLSGSVINKLSTLRKLTRGQLVHIHFGDGRIHPLIRSALWGRKIVVTYHSVYRHKRTWLMNRIDQFWASRASGIVAVSDAVKDFCVKDVRIPEKRVSVIKNGVDIRPISVTTNEGDNSFTLISLAGLYPHKNHIELLNGIAEAKKLGINIKLRVIGDGPMMAELYQQCIKLDLHSNIEWYGAIWRQDIIQSLIASSHGFVSASKFEGLPISILEAMSYGLPMLLSDIPPHRELADKSALYFSIGDLKGFTEQLQSLVNNSDLQVKMKNDSLKRVKKFELQRCVESYLDCYSKITGEKTDLILKA